MKERARIVADVAAAKGPAGSATIIHPAREARVLKRRLGDHDGPFPPAIVVHVWRTVISAACSLQRPFRIHVADLADGGMRDLARFWLGFEAELVAADDGAGAVEALAEAPGDLALVPLGAEDGWWLKLGDGAHIVARLAGRTAKASDVAILGGALVGPSDEGHSIFRIDLPAGATAPQLNDVEILARADGSALVASALPAATVAERWSEATGALPELVLVGGYDPDLVTAAGGAPAADKE